MNYRSNKITNPEVVAELFKSSFVEIVDKLAEQSHKVYAPYKMTKSILNTRSEIIFIMPESEDEVEKVFILREIFDRYTGNTKFHCKEMYVIYKETPYGHP